MTFSCSLAGSSQTAALVATPRCVRSGVSSAIAPSLRLRGREAPRRDRDAGQHDRDEHSRDAVTRSGVRDGGAAQVEEDSRIGPLLETWKARYQHGDASEHLPDADERGEVGRIAQVPQEGDDGRRGRRVGRAAEHERCSDETGGHPVADGLELDGNAWPRTLSCQRQLCLTMGARTGRVVTASLRSGSWPVAGRRSRRIARARSRR